jgi:regulator of extracellular matrix RemA (YlzA/DUF370 family)
VINVGFGNVVAVKRIVSVVRAGSAPLRRLVDRAEKEARLVDATSGRKTRSVIVTDSNQVVLSHMSPASIVSRLKGETEPAEESTGAVE